MSSGHTYFKGNRKPGFLFYNLRYIAITASTILL